MYIYKELSFVGDKLSLDEFKRKASSFASADWKYTQSDRMKNYIAFDYVGNKVEQAEVSIFYGRDSWREGYIKVGNIVTLSKDQLSINGFMSFIELLDIISHILDVDRTKKFTTHKPLGNELL